MSQSPPVLSIRGTLRELTRWQRAEITIIHVVVAGLAVALPIAIGEATGQLPLGMMGAIGALLMSTSGHAGSLRFRLVDMGATLIVGTAAVALGAWSNTLPDVVAAVVLVLIAILLAAVGGFHRTAAKISTLATVFMIVGGSVGGHAPVLQIAGGTAAGAMLAALLTLAGLAIERLFGLREAASAPVTPLKVSIPAWRKRMSTLPGWQYTFRLGSSLIVGEAIALQLHGEHSSWILLTIALVVQRDHATALARTVQRGVGTAVGVLLGSVFLLPVPMWVLVVTVGVIGGLRPYLRGANYAAYAVVMTPLVAVFTGLGAAMTTELLVERLVDTLIGCLIAIVVGWAAWSWLAKRPAAPA